MGQSKIQVAWEESGRTQEGKEWYNRDGEVAGDRPGRLRESEVAGGESCGKGKLRESSGELQVAEIAARGQSMSRARRKWVTGVCRR